MSHHSDTPAHALTLVELLRERAQQEPDFGLYTFLVDGEKQEDRLTYAALDRRARAIAARLAELPPGTRILLLYVPGVEYIAAFFGCLYAGMVAVPVYPPRHDRSLLRLQAIAIDAQAAAGLIRSEHLELLRQFYPIAPALARLSWIVTDEIDDRASDTWTPPQLSSGSLAFFQYTSGSTSLPKGVTLTHRNLLHNLEAIRRCFRQDRTSRAIIWLPPYHDMGLIGGILQPLYTGYPAVLMSPMDFLQQPLRWLQAISRYRGTTSGGPDFAYALCTRKIRPEQCEGLDLSCWRVAFNGAEPIRPETLDRFTQVFGPAGFRRETFYPCYGLAEATLIVSGSEVGQAPQVESFDGQALQRGQAIPVEAGHAEARQLVSSGRRVIEGRLAVVDPETFALRRDGEIGEIWVSSESVAGGYWGQPEATGRTFQARLRGTGEGPFLRTGDLGFLRDGELFVTGRAKDLIIIRGLNHYPQDIELTVEQSHPAVRPGSGAAFSVEAGGTEQLVVVYEATVQRVESGLDEVINAIRRAVAGQHELVVYAVVLIEPGSVPKTSSGKIQRHACRAAFLAGELQVLAHATLDTASPGTPTAVENALPGSGDSPLWREVAEEVSQVLPLPIAATAGQAELVLDSLSSVELQHRLQLRLGVIVPLPRLLGSRNLAGIVAGVEAARAAGARWQPEDPAGAELGDFPLSHGQRALWFMHQLAPDSAAYHIAAALRVLEPLDEGLLRRAVRRLVERHPSLRTTFHAHEGTPFQRVHPDGEACFRCEDASAWSEDTLRARLREEASLPFELQQGPLLRLRLYQRSGTEQVLLVVAHHLIADFWSLGQLARELSALYPAERNGAAVVLPAPAASYVDAVLWEQERLESEHGQRLWEYWRRRLSGSPPVLEHLADHPRPPVQTYRGGRRERVLDAALTARLKELFRRETATPFAPLLAAYATLLHRHNGQREIWVGAPTVGRERAELAETAGYFVNPLVLRLELDGGLSFRALMAEVSRTVHEALEHAAMPFSLLVERLAPLRQASRSPLFQTIFSFQQSPPRSERGLAALAQGTGGARISLAGVAMESLELELGTAQLDLALSIAELDGRFHVALEYNTDLFEPGTAERLLRRYESLLRSAVEHPNAPLAVLQLDPAEDRARLLAWGRAMETPPPACIHTWIGERARLSPEKAAILSGAESLTYGELDARANALAWRLRELGVGPDTLVVIYLERSIEQLVAVLGILKAGGAYVPLDPEFSNARRADVIADSEARIAVTRASHAAFFATQGVTVVTVEPGEARHEPPPSAVTPENLAYVIYTSGSTGRPKGVMVSHRALASLVQAERVRFGVVPEDRILQFNSLSFDSSVEEIFLALCTGATLVLRDAAMLATVEGFLAGCEQWAVTLLDLPTAFFHTVVAAITERELPLPSSLRFVIVAGERVRADRVTQWHRRAPPSIHLINVYGPTEATVSATCHDLPAATTTGLDDVPIGQPLRTMGAYVLDGRLEPVPAGGVGELWLTGEGLARGYFRDPALTAERFMVDPHATAPGSRMYRTGDLARMRADGVLEYLGRADEQVKIRGFRVELGEIETALRACEGVRDALVLLQGENAGKEARLIAYVVAAPEVAPSALRAQLAARLPPYMVPAAIVRLDAFPYGSSGKVDRRALPPPPSSIEGEAPRTSTEAVLAGIWADVLQLGRVGIDQGFFELGGHSLLAMQVIARLRSTFGVELPLRALFEEGTIAALAARIDQAGKTPATRPLVRASRSAPLPLSFAQQRLWLLAQMEPGSAAYNMPGTLHLLGRLDAAALEFSLSELTRRHEILRTRLLERAGEPVQLIEPSVELPFEVEDLRALPPGQREDRAAERVRTEVARPFDLSRAPLMRARLLRLGEEEHRLVVVLHHIVCDAWSLDILFRDLAEFYGARSAGRAAALPALEVQYADFAVWQRKWLDGEVLERQLAHWRRTLEGAPAELELPLSRRTRSIGLSPAGVVRRPLPAPLMASLHAFCHAEGATPFMAMLAAFEALLHRHTGQRDLVVGTPVAHRTHEALEGVAGFFVNTLVLRTHLPERVSFRQLVARVREVALTALAHQDLPFEKLVEAVRPARTSSRPPFLQLMFLLRDTPGGGPILPGLKTSFEEVLPGQAKFDLLLEIEQRGDGWGASWQFDTTWLPTEAVARMAEHFERLLRGALEHPDAPLARLPLLTGQEVAVIARANGTGREYPREAAIHQRFEEQAARTPHAVAVELEGQRLTYGELAQRSNQLAHHLRRRGVRPDTRVGLYVRRSFERVIGMLGILKAGGAYLPLEPGHPRERLTLMLTDADARLVLTEEALAPALEGVLADRLCLDAGWPSIAGEPTEGLPDAVGAENLAYVMYTSGSTGQPKGVCVPHRAVVRLVTAPNYVKLSAEDAFLHLAPFSFDAATLEIWGPLLNGGRLVLFPGDGTPLDRLEDTLARHRVTALWLTAGLFHNVVEHHLEALSGVRQLLAGGDVLSPAHVRRVLERHPGLRLINGYGPTENTTFTCCHPMEAPDEAEAPVPIGAPITGTRVYVLDAGLEPVPLGAPGELYCAGDGLARGYIGRAGLTAERFLPDPFNREPGSRMYRTGDLVCWRTDGCIEFLGRVDNQVKVRGFRIEPGEVEATLLRHPALRDAAVVAAGERADTKRLVAHVVLRDASAVTSGELRGYLEPQLPEHMLPSAVVFHHALPLSPNGKVDRRALAQEPLDSPQTGAPLSAPRTAAELALTSIWRELLGRTHVGIHENFFELGGHSLLATRLLSRVRETTGIALPLKSLFEGGTVATLAERIEAASRSRQAASRPLSPVARGGPLPLSYSQQRLWFLAQLEPHASTYNIPGALRLTGALDVAVLEQCLETLLERHEVLRTAFESQEGRPVQRIVPVLKLKVPVEDLRALPAGEREACAREIEKKEAEQPFELAEPPLLRVRLLRLDEQEHALLVTLHHIVSDGWSLGVLFREMTALYEAFSAGKQNPLPPLPIQYADFAYWQRHWLQGELLERQLQYWRQQLAGAPARLALPSALPRPEVPSHRGKLVVGRLSPQDTEALRKLGRQEGTTLFMTALAAFYTLLYRLTGSEDIVVGAPLANRAHPLTEDLIGFFVNTLALRCQVQGSLSFQELLQRVRALTLEAYEHQDVPFERVVDELGIERSLSYNPLFQVLFVLQNAPLPPLRLGNLSMSQVTPNFDAVKFDLVVILEEHDGGLAASWSYDADIFDEAAIARMHRQYELLLRQLAGGADRSLARLELQTETERKQEDDLKGTRRASDFDRLRRIKPKPVTPRRPGEEG
ncbi:amino acid adenylation domain-containing protein [Stigmatella aurantiaca]|uniref:Amino acid adenylation domain-containing protein n=1 Tax=Stigmatella aurantiaca TaxID=41 RepID=A0A1H8AFJ8_STIAU|nr:non-ribosomal peptide synthetase [Stigmatella aurantiaca]SEM69381.1 amino acid adenylation domain-containing protein [Stigmatella aurantiaca]